MDLCLKAAAQRSEPDRFHEGGFRVNAKASRGERNTIRHAALLLVQASRPLLIGQEAGKRQHPVLEEQDRQRAAEQGGLDQVIEQVVEAKPQCGRGRQLCVAPSHPTAGEADEAGRENRGASP